jgi:hypothetical protein
MKLAPWNDLSAISPKSRPNFSAKFRSLGGSSGRAFLHMLTATRDDGPHAHGAHAAHYGTHTPPRSLASRFAGGIQIVGSLVGIPLALIGGYSTYHSTFSPEGRCQALRGNIVSMLDKKADASTLRLLVQKDVVTFERECGEVDADAATAFKTLLAAEKPAAAHRIASPSKVEKVEKAEKVEAAVAQPPAKVEKTEKVEKHEPAKREIVKRDVAKLDSPKQQLGAPPQPLVAPPPAVEKAEAPQPPAEKTAEQPKPVEAAAVQAEKANVDATWVASVRDALRESASRPAAAETSSDVAAPMSKPIDISPEAQVASGASAERTGPFTPPGNIGPGGSRPQAPRPPGLIPNAN